MSKDFTLEQFGKISKILPGKCLAYEVRRRLKVRNFSSTRHIRRLVKSYSVHLPFLSFLKIETVFLYLKELFSKLAVGTFCHRKLIKNEDGMFKI